VTELLFAAPPVPAAPARGRSERIPIGRISCVGCNDEAHARDIGVAVDREVPGTPEDAGPVNTGDVLRGAIEGVGAITLTIGPAE
jgi:hypothetical protein